jgi:hypothetical protein
MKYKLYIVHCVDTEGPIFETLEVTFDRLKTLYNISLEPNQKTLLKLQNRGINLNGLENDVAKTFSAHNLSYKDTWTKIDDMLFRIMSEQYRNKYIDSQGNGIIYNWHCLDQAGFTTNKRRKDIGFGNIFNHYKQIISETESKDRIHWHFHPLAFNRESHICSTSYDNSYYILHEVLCRRLIDNKWFPLVNRAGFHAIRQDSSFFLEQWIPFDYSNQSTYEDNSSLQTDAHRFGDWRNAPKEWIPYHPSYDNYQVPGSMNRVTTKCLNIGTRYKLLTDTEIENAFKDAIDNGTAILSFTNHDFRDMSLDIDDIYTRIHNIAYKYKDVELINSDALNAMQKMLFDEDEIKREEITIEARIVSSKNTDKLIVKCKRGKTFGSQPYLAIKTKEGKYYHDNLHEVVCDKEWEYYLDDMTINICSIDTIGVASNDKYGNQSIVTLNA